ncbi:U1 small nuclear ribonucleoprotein C-like [Herrania umbratica]|uniref:U1 small nuclear ribonucleoprotein C-like n=1 Tax=Herrania umbratica TaxID=108875 RepID=A0A6J1BGA6_9ROSI|nr:U1 small nuclear ribonucleoprotein C-like [Herrania umbratica]
MVMACKTCSMLLLFLSLVLVINLVPQSDAARRLADEMIPKDQVAGLGNKEEAKMKSFGEMKNSPPFPFPLPFSLPDMPFAPPLPQVPINQLPPFPFPPPFGVPPFPFPPPFGLPPFGLPPFPGFPFPPVAFPPIPFFSPPPP